MNIPRRIVSPDSYTCSAAPGPLPFPDIPFFCCQVILLVLFPHMKGNAEDVAVVISLNKVSLSSIHFPVNIGTSVFMAE